MSAEECSTLNALWRFCPERDIFELLDFGVEQVVWLFTDSEKVMLAAPNGPWITVNWSDEITVLGQTFVIESLLNEEGF